MTVAPLLKIQDLKVHFYTLRGVVHALERVSFELKRQETLGLAGETGCGKSVTARSVLRLIDPPGKILKGRIIFEGQDLLSLDEAAMRRIRGGEISMIMQEPKMSLNPVIRVGEQIAETLIIHDKTLNRRSARTQAEEMLAQLGIPDPTRMARRYPHELSGGMSQRIMIAMMLVTSPKLLIADEPTTALDVTIQAQILDLLLSLQEDTGMALILITHDLGVVAQTTQRTIVMYAGHIVEEGPTEQLIRTARHPYTQGLINALPERTPAGQPLNQIPGVMPPLTSIPPGCAFHPRCQQVMPICRSQLPAYSTAVASRVACHWVAQQENSR